MPLVSDNYHEKFERRVIEKLRAIGFSVSSATYHDVLERDVSEALARNYSPTALYIRTRADRIAVRHDLSFELECKTHENARYEDMTLEILPVIHHINKVDLGVDCLYAYWNPFTAMYRGFWVSDMPRVRDIRIPSNTRYDDDAVGVVKQAESIFDEARVYTNAGRGDGSNDPYIIIDKSDVQNMRRLKDIFDSIELLTEHA